MVDANNRKECGRGSWGLAALAGIVIFLALKFLAGWSFWGALLIGLIAFVFIGVLCVYLLCSGSETPSVSGEMGGAGAGSTGHVSGASETTQDRTAGSAETGAADVGDPASAQTAAAPAATPAKPVEIKPSTALAGQEDLANRTLDWKYVAPAAEATKVAAPKVTAAPTAEATPDYDGDGVLEGENEGTRPEALTQAREGGADDLKRIKGIGPKLEKLCNELGFYHFDQIAGWSADEVAWVNANLAGFKGRVSRDNWVEQAKLLASGGETEFSKRVDNGGVY